MDIGDIEALDIGNGRVEVRATVAGVPLEIRLPADRFDARALGDALVVSTLVPAMRAGSTLRLPASVPVSTTLVQHLPAIQRIYRNWNCTLHEVELDARTETPANDGAQTGLFYAGGIDSSYSMIAHEHEVDVLITVLGFDMAMDEHEMEDNRVRNTAFARAHGKDIVFAESNHRIFLRRLGVSRTFVFGAMLASVALLLRLRRCYVASSHSVGHLRPEGSHPVLDGYYSNGSTEIVHDDVTVSRFGKTRAIAARPDILGNLRVCWDYPNENCGHCLKCLRTMAALKLCGTRGPFPDALSMPMVRQMAARTELDYIVEMAVEADRAGDGPMVRALRSGLRRQDFKEALRHLAYAVTMRKLHRPGGNPQERELAKYDLRPDLDLGRTRSRR